MSRTSMRIFIATILALLALVVTGALGVWQYSRAYRADVEVQTLNAKTISLNKVSKRGEYVPEKYYGQKVQVVGKLLCDKTFRNVIPAQEIDWHIAAIQLADNSLVAIASNTDFCESQSAQTSWIGRMQPAQDFAQLPAIYKPTPTTSAINTDDLVLRWKSDVRDGYVLITRDVRPELIVLPPVGIDIRNLFYAWQWWLFAGFTIFLFTRFVRDELNANATE